jgi:hypothetical protein
MPETIRRMGAMASLLGHNISLSKRLIPDD